jgi:hypothetical protein
MILTGGLQMTKEELRAKRKERIAKIKAAKESKATYRYDPIRHKPTKLDPVGPRNIGFFYVGPMPDTGMSYGEYEDDQKNKVVTIKGERMYSPYTGKEMKLNSDVVAEEVLAAQEVYSTAKFDFLGSKMLAITPEAYASLEKMFSPICGTEMDEGLAACREALETEAERETEAETEETTAEDITEKFEKELDLEEEGEEQEETKAQEDLTDLEEGDEDMEYQSIAKIEELKELTDNDFHATLYNQEDENPFWNIEVVGMPLARVELSSQEKPEEIRAAFTSPEYAEHLVSAMCKMGIEPVLEGVNAKMWSNEVKKSSLATKIREEVKSELIKEHTDKLVELKDKFMNCLEIATAGMNKNFFKNMGNPLKEALFAELEKAGVYNPIGIIEAAFSDSSSKFFDGLFKKTVDLMDMHEEAREEIAKAIVDNNTLDVTKENNPAPEQAATFASRLAQASVPVQAASASADSKSVGDLKAEMKAKIRLGKK